MRTVLLLGCAGAAIAGCAASPAPCPAPPPVATPPAASAPAPAAPKPSPEADLVLLLRPLPSPKPVVHVELSLTHAEAATGPWRIARGAPDRVTHATAHDDAGDIAVDVSSAGAGVELRLGRGAHGVVTVAYDVLAEGDAPDDPSGLYVVDDRFRAAGERLVALPAAADAARAPVLVRIDGDALRASAAASSLGVGTARRATVPFRALRYATFVAGSLGVEVIDDPAAGHDEGAWLGYTAFDPRPVVAELAQIRSSFRDLLKSEPDPSWTYLFVTQTRPIGSFTTTPRWTSTLLQTGPAEPWSAALRLSMAQQLARRWIGGELRVATEPGREAEGWWLSEGVSRYVATLLLSRLGLLSPDDVRDAIGGELSVVATSPDRALDDAHLAALAAHDEAARATIMARGALYALAEAAALRARTKDQRGLDVVIQGLLHAADEHGGAPIALSAWTDALSKDDPDALGRFDALVVRGEAPVLPAGALGPCFRAGTGEYVAYDAGFDAEATRMSKDGKAVGVRPGGPAARAGLVEGDLVESMQTRAGDSSVPVKLVVVRGGAKVPMTYAPRGARGRGQSWTRVRGVPDARCGEVL